MLNSQLTILPGDANKWHLTGIVVATIYVMKN